MIVGRLVNMCIQSGETLDTLTLRDFRAISSLFDGDIYDPLDLRHCVSERKVFGGPSLRRRGAASTTSGTLWPSAGKAETMRITYRQGNPGAGGGGTCRRQGAAPRPPSSAAAKP